MATYSTIKDRFNVGRHKSREILPEQLLTREEAKRLIEATEHPRDRAYVSISDESGARIGEILGKRIKSVAFDQYGAVIIVVYPMSGAGTGIRSHRACRAWLRGHMMTIIGQASLIGQSGSAVFSTACLTPN